MRLRVRGVLECASHLRSLRSLRALRSCLCLSGLVALPFLALSPYRGAVSAALRGHPRAPHLSCMSSAATPTPLVEVPNARAALLQAVARGRAVPPTEVEPVPALQQGPHPRCLEGLAIEELLYRSDDSSQGWVPLRLAKLPGKAAGRLPVAILCHPTGSCLDDLAQRQAEYAQRGYLAAAIDARYHGQRADPALPYQRSLVKAWRDGGERPFLLDNVWDLQRLLDLLEGRPDVDPARVGVTGYSLGGMHSWLLAAADERVAVAAPMAGVQHFRWAVEHDRFHARVGSIPEVFAAAAQDMGRRSADAEVVAAVWDRLLPGMLELYDAPESLPLIAPRPLLVANGAADLRCPVEGVEIAVAEATKAYAACSALDRLRLFVEPGVGHECTPAALAEVDAWMDRHLLLGG